MSRVFFVENDICTRVWGMAHLHMWFLFWKGKCFLQLRDGKTLLENVHISFLNFWLTRVRMLQALTLVRACCIQSLGMNNQILSAIFVLLILSCPTGSSFSPTNLILPLPFVCFLLSCLDLNWFHWNLTLPSISLCTSIALDYANSLAEDVTYCPQCADWGKIPF